MFCVYRSIGLFIGEENGALKFSEGKYDYIIHMHVAVYVHNDIASMHINYQFQITD